MRAHRNNVLRASSLRQKLVQVITRLEAKTFISASFKCINRWDDLYCNGQSVDKMDTFF